MSPVHRTSLCVPAILFSCPRGGFNVYMKQRVGRPRGHWAEDVMNKAMLQLTGNKFDRDDYDHYIFLISEALMRII